MKLAINAESKPIVSPNRGLKYEFANNPASPPRKTISKSVAIKISISLAIFGFEFCEPLCLSKME